MNVRYARRAAPVAIAIVVLAIVAFLPVTVPTADESGTPLPGIAPAALTNASNTPITRPIGGLFGSNTAKQQFPALGERIQSVALFLGTYQRENHGTLKVTIQSDTAGAWQDLATQAVDKAAIRDNAYQTIEFSPGLAVVKGQALQILVTTNGSANDAVTWWVNGDWQPEGYALFYNGKRQEGTARFLVSYAPVSGHLFQHLGPLWRRLTLFLDPLWQIVLVFGLCIMVGTFVLLGRHLME